MSDAALTDNDLIDTLLDLVSEDDTAETPRATPLRPLRLARVRHEGRPWLFHTVRVPDGAHVHKGDRVIFEVPGDSAFGTLIDEPVLRLVEGDPAALPQLKALSPDEVAQIAERVSRREAEAFAYFRERIQSMRLPMKPVHIEMSALSSRVVFYFWSDARVDFRHLLQDLRKRVQGTIELTQVGSHEAARQIGGIGRCQRELCSRVLPTYPPVSPKHARTQGLSPNPQKHMGACGRLMGCLAYEQEQYAEARKGLPKEGKTVETPLGKAVIKELDILRGRVRVRTEDGQWETFHVSELKRDGKPLVASTEPETLDTMDADADDLLDFELSGRPLETADVAPEGALVDASPLARAAAAAPRPAGRPAQGRPAPRAAATGDTTEARPPREPRPPRPERTDRPERTERPDRPERPDRGPRPEQPRGPDGRPPRGERPERGPSGERPERGPSGERPDRGPRPDRLPGQGTQGGGQARKPQAPQQPARKPNPPAAERPAPAGEGLPPERTGADGEDADLEDYGPDDGPDGAEGAEGLDGQETGIGPDGRPRRRRRRRRTGGRGGAGGGSGGGGQPSGGG